MDPLAYIASFLYVATFVLWVLGGLKTLNPEP